MDFKITEEKTINVSYLRVSVGARYYEDAKLNGIEDAEKKMPCIIENYWCPLIDIDSGRILNWEEGNKADLHYKVCDNGKYSLMNAYFEVLKDFTGYVPSIMSPNGESFGDYIIMKIDEKGFIENWNPSSINDFNDYQDLS